MLSKFNCNTLGWKTVPFIFMLQKSKFYEIPVFLSSVGILFHDDSTFCSEVTCFERNLGVSHFFCNI